MRVAQPVHEIHHDNGGNGKGVWFHVMCNYCIQFLRGAKIDCTIIAQEFYAVIAHDTTA